MSKRLAVALISVGWLFAAVTIWKAGAWSERVHRYDGCEYVNLTMHQSAWLCPAERRSPAKPPEDEPGSQA